MMSSKVSLVAILVVAATTMVSVADGYCLWYGHCGTNPEYPDGPFGGKPLNKYDNTSESQMLPMLQFVKHNQDTKLTNQTKIDLTE